jgi:hypothetical protein
MLVAELLLDHDLSYTKNTFSFPLDIITRLESSSETKTREKGKEKGWLPLAT